VKRGALAIVEERPLDRGPLLDAKQIAERYKLQEHIWLKHGDLRDELLEPGTT
jgi:hypothetical protein